MIISLAALLLVNTLFAVVVWPTFYRRVAADSRSRDTSGRATKFLTVHRVIVGTALVIAAASLAGAICALL